ncbi:MAG: L,D-transpeptidase [Desulfomonile sp.]|nr:L,D-transpeptidase [Desulfomonile sp.]
MVVLALSIVCFQFVPVNAGDGSVRELLLGAVRPGDFHPDGSSSKIDRLLEFPVWKFPGPYSDVPLVLRNWPGRVKVRGEDALAELGPRGPFYPGRMVYFVNDGARVPSKLSRAMGRGDRVEDLFGTGRPLEQSGSLVADPTRIYSRLEIRVNRSAYTLQLFGYRGDEEKLIFGTRVGLGSPDYPTPRGTFYITRIFDDKPIWIPPQDRPWAWGQLPSRSVYGGHMMPFFSKRALKAQATLEEQPDKVAPRMEMIDAGMYRIHGTDSPWSVGSGQSHGCVRMLNKTVKELADALKLYVGTSTRGESPNGPYVNLARPVKLILY